MGLQLIDFLLTMMAASTRSSAVEGADPPDDPEQPQQQLPRGLPTAQVPRWRLLLSLSPHNRAHLKMLLSLHRRPPAEECSLIRSKCMSLSRKMGQTSLCGRGLCLLQVKEKAACQPWRRTCRENQKTMLLLCSFSAVPQLSGTTP